MAQPPTPNTPTDPPPSTPPAPDGGEGSYRFARIMLLLSALLLPAIALFGYIKYLITGD